TQSLDSAPILQSPTITGNPGGNGIAIDPGSLSANGRWRSMGVPFILHDDVVVSAGTTLIIDPGCVVKLQPPGCDNTSLIVDGTLSALGTVVSPIIFTSYLDDAGNDTNNNGSATSPAAGNWERIRFSGLGSGSVMTYCVARYGGRSYTCSGTNANPMIDIAGTSPSIDYCTFSNAYSTVVQCGPDGTAKANPPIHHSSLLASTTVFGLNNTDPTVTINAIDNWWGHSTGPLDNLVGNPDHNPGGLGAKVSDYVTYRPWWTTLPSPYPVASVLPEIMNIGVPPGEQRTRPMLVFNKGDASLSFSAYEAAGTDAQSASPTEVSWFSVSPTSGIVAPDGRMSLQVTFTAPVDPQPRRTAYLIFQTNDPVNDHIVVPLELDLPPVDVNDPLADDIRQSRLVEYGPSPATGTMRFGVEIASGDPATLAIFDISGRQIRAFDWAGGEGRTVVLWDGRMEDGREAPSGMYVVRFRASQHVAMHRIVRLR
ncbi:MAG TPA: T9SS type A sorting domain-containing protein, partial [Candidatus Eisenbacteria bacterium]|nr:T9SS type A sorting domain-containing protein [Candidatus Eisenbacteria bacterium]